MKAYRKWVLSLGIAAVAPGIALAGPFSIFSKSKPQARPAATVDNQRLAEEVAKKLRAEKLTGFDIEIEVSEGVCLLAGRIKDAEQKQRASVAASQVAGVNRINNQLQLINGNPAPSATLANRTAGTTPRTPEVVQASRFQPAPEPETKSGVSLAGFFKPGKRQQTSSQNEQQVANQIAGAIGQSGVRGHDLSVKFKQGVATLSGICRSPQDVARITQVVAQVPGVRQVENQIDIPGMQRSLAPAPFASTPSSTAPTMQGQSGAPGTPNQQVAEQIAQALAANHLGGLDIEVRFNSGVATLGGAVKHPQQAAWAAHVAQQVPGVQRVENRLGFAAAPPIQQAGFQQPGPGGYPRGPAGGMPGRMPPGMPPGMQGGMPGGYPGQQMSFQGGPGGMVPPMPGPAAGGHGGPGASHLAYDLPNLPNHAWPSYASYPNSAQISYPTEYSASAWPYIGPFYPYPQVPMGWRDVRLQWDDGAWSLAFNSRTDKWFWFLSPKNW